MVGRPRKYLEVTHDILYLHKAGNTVREIAFNLSVPKSTVHRIIRRYKLGDVE